MMRNLLVSLICSFIPFFSTGQSIVSGEYESGLILAYDDKTRILTGYYENYTGWDEQLKVAKFSCIFYLEGLVDSNTCKLMTYYPEDKFTDSISGILEIIDSITLSIRLWDDHGGCWNVQHFAQEPISFRLAHKSNSTVIRYVVSPKTYFHSGKSDKQKQRAYLVKNDFVCIEKMEGAWAYCTYSGEKTRKGWIKIADLNQ